MIIDLEVRIVDKFYEIATFVFIAGLLLMICRCSDSFDVYVYSNDYNGIDKIYTDIASKP
jgi:hypothetical protein